ncbi:hypothetical protein E2986_04967, partial [Frieseomelitta varia]
YKRDLRSILYIFWFGISLSEAGTSVLDTSFENRGRINSLKIESKKSKSIKAKLSRLYLKLRQQTKMVGSNGTMIAIRLVRSKLRKREDHSNAVHPEAAVVQTATSPVSTIVAPSYPGEGCCTQTSVTTTSTDLGSSTAVEQDNVYATANPTDQIVWQFPPPYPPPHTPAQYALYNDQDTLVHALPSDRSGFAKGFRKNIGGRWRRLVKRKPESETCAIPPELKEQLKTIYVY